MAGRDSELKGLSALSGFARGLQQGILAARDQNLRREEGARKERQFQSQQGLREKEFAIREQGLRVKGEQVGIDKASRVLETTNKQIDRFVDNNLQNRKQQTNINLKIIDLDRQIIGEEDPDKIQQFNTIRDSLLDNQKRLVEEEDATQRNLDLLRKTDTDTVLKGFNQSREGKILRIDFAKASTEADIDKIFDNFMARSSSPTRKLAAEELYRERLKVLFAGVPKIPTPEPESPFAEFTETGRERGFVETPEFIKQAASEAQAVRKQLGRE